MAELPSASVTIDDEAGAIASGVDLLTVFACVPSTADATPRLFANTKAILSLHDYSQAVDYCAMHFEETNKPVLFVPLPIVTVGTLGRQNSTGVTGNCAITVAAGAKGVLEEVDAILTVTRGTTIGTDQIGFDLSLDGGRTSVPVRLGTASSYTIPYVGIILNFGAGTLNVDDVYTFGSTAPRWDQAGLAAGRAALASQQKASRSWLVVGDLVTAQDATDVEAQASAYATANDRFTEARAQIKDHLPAATLAHVTKRMTGSPSLTFANVGSADTITRGAGSFITDGFVVGDIVTIAGSASNNVTGAIAVLTATVITFGASTSLANEGPVGGCTINGTPGLTFAEVGVTGDTITRSDGSWTADGFRVGDIVTITGTASNNVTGPIASLSTLVLTFGTTDLAAEVIGSSSVTITAGQTKAAWIAAEDAIFASIDSKPRIDLGAGRGFKRSPITGWDFRRPVQWAASIREYQHDVQIPTWRKSDGPCDGWDLNDDNGNLVEFDERIDSGALAARFTCFRTYSNGPRGAFIALSLTRAVEGSLLSRTHNMAVANIACGVTQTETENAIGQVLVLNDDGTGSDASLSVIEERVNSALQVALLQAKAEGPRASIAKWKASRTDVLNVPGAELTGALDLELNGTLEKISTVVRIQTAG